jgi:hypothetical protein
MVSLYIEKYEIATDIGFCGVGRFLYVKQVSGAWKKTQKMSMYFAACDEKTP